MNSMKKIFLLLLLVLVNCSIFAQFSLDGELRPRFEYRDGYRNLMPQDADPATMISQRSLLGLTYKTDLYTTRISFQDVRVWGSEALKTNEISASLVEAWVEFNVSDGFKIKTGRQILKYDNQRLIGVANWNQIASRHDAVKLSYKKNSFEFEVVGASNQTAQQSDLVEVPYELYDKLYKNLGIVWMKQAFENFSIATLSVFEGLRENNVNDKINTRITSGLIFNYQQKKISTALRTFYQGGKKQDGSKVSAYFINATFDYKYNSKITLKAGMEYFSGNDDPNMIGEKDNAFDVIYGGRHGFNGKMDYFLKPASTLGLGLIDWSVGLNAKLAPKVTLYADYHYFRTQRNFTMGDVLELTNYSAYLGSEFDIQLDLKISKEILISALYGMMLPSDAMAAIRNREINTAHYFMTMLTFKPVFLKKQEINGPD